MDESLHESVVRDLQQITAALAELVGSASRWNGQVTIEAGALYSGAKRYDCSICIREEIARHPVYRWRTLIHEALHGFSPQYSRYQYEAWKGWEEGVIEKLQRLFRGRVLLKTGIYLAESDLEQIEAQHPFNGYIAVLDDLRQQLGLSAETFFVLLLRTELPRRVELVHKLGEDLLDPQAKARFRTSLLLAQGKLSKKAGYEPRSSN